MKTRILTAVASSFSLLFAPASFAQQGATEAQQEAVEEESPFDAGSPAAAEPAKSNNDGAWSSASRTGIRPTGDCPSGHAGVEQDHHRLHR
jgi:hypothetical protein